MPREIAAARSITAPDSRAFSDVALHVTPERRRRVVTVLHGQDCLIIRTTGYHSLRELATAFAGIAPSGREAAVQALVDAAIGATGLESEDTSGIREIRLPVPVRGAGLSHVLAVAIQKAVARSGGDPTGDLDFAQVVVRQGRLGSYLVEVRRWCSQATAAFIVRRLPSAAHSDTFEIRF